jgi:two-component system C4-dicarboxylate transport response regulator DctD
MHVLLIEDDDATRQLLAGHLRASAHQVTAVDSSESATVVVHAWGPPDVVVSDINLPGLSGLEFTLGLRRRFGPDRLGLVLISGEHRPPALADDDAFAARHAFLTKPCRSHELLTAVQLVSPAA